MRRLFWMMLVPMITLTMEDTTPSEIPAVARPLRRRYRRVPSGRREHVRGQLLRKSPYFL